MNKNKIAFFTNDVETTSIVNNNLSFKTGEKVLKEGMPILLELYEKYNVKATFFFNCDIVEKYPEVVKMILPYGHEVASHGFTHEVNKAFDILSLEEQIEHLHRSKVILEDLSGTKVISFRAPALRVNEFTVSALERTGYLIDSSIASQRFDFFLSFGSIKKLSRLIAPRLPYKADYKNLSKKGSSNITEIPISAFILPYIGTTLRIFPKITLSLGRALKFESVKTNKPINFLVHPNEFIKEIQVNKDIERRGHNFFSYLFGDIIRNKLKLKNLGYDMIPLFEKELKYFANNNFNFITLKEYYDFKKDS